MGQHVGTFQSTRIEVHGLPMHTMVSADAVPPGTPAVVLVHGLGLSHRYMMPVAERLALTYRVYVPDLPGFGDSGKPSQILDVAGLADALAAWMQEAGLERAALLGNSFGCQIIVDMAARYPARVTRAVLQGPTTDPTERSWLWQFVRWRQNAPYNPPALGPMTRRDYRKCGLHRLFQTARYFWQDRVEEKLPQVHAPVLVVRGQRDPICRQRWVEEVIDRLPHGRLVVIPGVAHTLVYTSPLELARVISPFLDEANGERTIRDRGFPTMLRDTIP
jgi:2-hydroxy-6-oxonona-2,4-dienedioate hydrolase